MSRITSFRVLGVFLGLWLLAPLPRADAEPTKIAFGAFSTLHLDNVEKDFEFGPELKIGDLPSGPEHRIRLLGRLPLGGDDEDAVYVDKNTEKYRIVASYYLDLDFTGDTGSSRFLRMGASGDWSRQKFEYYPDGGKDAKTQTKNSFAAEAIGLFYVGTTKGYQYAPQLKLRLDRSYKEQDEVGLVTGVAPGEATKVRSVVVDAPVAKPVASVRFSTPMYLPYRNLPMGLGPSVLYTTQGAKDDALGAKVQRLQWEAWLYYFPVSKGVVNVRVGLAAFGNQRLKNGADSYYGAILQLRVGTTLLEY